MSNIIEVDRLSFRYPGSSSLILKGISFVVEQGDFVAIVGNNGSGKSTLCKTLNGLIPHFYSGSFEGKVMVKGSNTWETSVAELSKAVGYIGQDFERQLVMPTVYEELCFAPLNYGLPDYKQRAEDMINQFNLNDIRNKHIWQLSGGQKHLVAVGSVIALNPDILIIDEPSAQLDPESAGQMYSELQTLNRKFGKTVLVIEHNAKWIAQYCQTVIFMELGQVLWKKAVRDALTDLNEIWKRKPTGIGTAADLPSGSYDKEKCIVSLENIQYTCNDFKRVKTDVIKGISLTAHERERIAVVGKIGSGKSTLLKMIAGILRPTRGIVKVMDTNMNQCGIEELSRFSMYVGQNPEGMFIEDTIQKDIELYFKKRDLQGKGQFIEEILEDFHLQHLRSRDGRLLSRGEQKRASLAIGAAMQSHVLLLDEPTASLDFESRRSMFVLLSKLEKYSDTIIVATHDMELAAEWATRILVMEDGLLRVEANG